MGSFPLKLYFYRHLLLLKGTTASLKIVAALSEQHISQALYFENSLFRIKQLTMLFVAQEVLYWFRIIHFYITMQSNQSNCNSIVLLCSRFALYLKHPHLDDSSLHRRSCAAGCSHRFYKCMCVWINSSHCCTINICRMLDKQSIFSAPYS